MKQKNVIRKFTRKLRECLSFERSGIGLYEVLVGKCEHAKELMLVQDELVHYLEDEREHVAYLERLLEELDGTDTGSLPGDLPSEAVRETLHNLVIDSLAPVIQNLEVLLFSELIDSFHWQLLLELAEKLEWKDRVTHLRNMSFQKQDHVDGLRLIIHELYVRENYLED